MLHTLKSVTLIKMLARIRRISPMQKSDPCTNLMSIIDLTPPGSDDYCLEIIAFVRPIFAGSFGTALDDDFYILWLVNANLCCKECPDFRPG